MKHWEAGVRIIFLSVAAFVALAALGIAAYLLLLGWVDTLPFAFQAKVFVDDNIRVSAVFFWIEVLAIVAGAPIAAMSWNRYRAFRARNILIGTLLSKDGYSTILGHFVTLQKPEMIQEIDTGSVRRSAFHIQRAIQRYENTGGSASENIAFQLLRLADTARVIADQVRNAPEKEDTTSYANFIALLTRNTQEMSTRIRYILQEKTPRKFKKLDVQINKEKSST